MRKAGESRGGSIVTERSQRAASPAYRWQLVAMLWVVGLLNYADRQAIFSVFPLLEARLHLDLAELGLLGSAFAWAYGLAAPFAGYAVDRLRRKTAILGGLEVWSWICAATAFTSHLWSLTILRCAMGLGESLYFPAALSLMSDYHGPRTRSRALALHQTSVYAGTIVGGFCAGWLAERYDWRSPFLCFGAIGALFGIVLVDGLREPTRGAAETSSAEPEVLSPPSFGSFAMFAMRTPAIRLLMGAFACANFVAVVLLAWMPSYLYHAFHMNLAMSGLTATALAQIGSMVGTIVGGWLADRLAKRLAAGRVVIQIVGVFCGAPFVFLCAQAHTMAPVLTSLAAWGFFKGLYDANIFASLFDVVPIAARGVAAGWMNTVGWIGGGLAPLLVGILAVRYGLGSAIALVSVVYLLAGSLLLRAFFTASRQVSEHHLSPAS
ncbi:MAG TPA: MFS transporter [Terracidiphilus sp.]|nr:MFS transporter [Terracidiphilus sp.]